MSELTLVEFLTARLKEDAAPTWTLVPYDCDPGCCAPAGWVGSQCRYCDRAPVYGGTVEAMTASAEEHAEQVHQRARVLVEVQAKRAIVATLVDAEAAVREAPLDARPFCDAYADGLRFTLRLLASVFSDHPEYRQEWTP